MIRPGDTSKDCIHGLTEPLYLTIDHSARDAAPAVERVDCTALAARVPPVGIDSIADVEADDAARRVPPDPTPERGVVFGSVL